MGTSVCCSLMEGRGRGGGNRWLQVEMEGGGGGGGGGGPAMARACYEGNYSASPKFRASCRTCFLIQKLFSRGKKYFFYVFPLQFWCTYVSKWWLKMCSKKSSISWIHFYKGRHERLGNMYLHISWELAKWSPPAKCCCSIIARGGRKIFLSSSITVLGMKEGKNRNIIFFSSCLLFFTVISCWGNGTARPFKPPNSESSNNRMHMRGRRYSPFVLANRSACGATNNAIYVGRENFTVNVPLPPSLFLEKGEGRAFLRFPTVASDQWTSSSSSSLLCGKLCPEKKGRKEEEMTVGLAAARRRRRGGQDWGEKVYTAQRSKIHHWK